MTPPESKSEWLKFTLAVDGYHAEVNAREVVLHADGRGYNQRDDRAYQVALLVPLDDARRVANLLIDAVGEAETRGMGNRG